MSFNKEMWEYGRAVEDAALPICNELFDCNFKRNENDLFDIIDFKDHGKKIVCEIKGRKFNHDKFEDTMISATKITEGYSYLDDGYTVYFIFVFEDKMFKYELHEDKSMKCKYTGQSCIKHYFIPIADCEEILSSISPVPEEVEMDEIN